jgi:hypothetical protein
MPRTFLCHHFWSLEQKVDFALEDHSKNLRSYRPVFRHLQNKVTAIEDFRLREDCDKLFGKIGSGHHATVEEVLSVRRAFEGKPFGIEHLTSRHLGQLCGMYGRSKFFGRSARMYQHAGILHDCDLALDRSGGPSTLTSTELRDACFWRGLNPLNTHQDDLVHFLDDWIAISKSLDSASLSLLLHAPLFLVYNNPNNWRLIYKVGGKSS